MSQRVTMKDLETTVARINRITNSPETETTTTYQLRTALKQEQTK
jgi:hypothetical protein